MVSSPASALVGNREAAKNVYFQTGKEEGLPAQRPHCFSEQHPPTETGGAFPQSVRTGKYAQSLAV